MAPKISYVITGRNDDHGGNFLDRTKTAIRTLQYLAGKSGCQIELILVEYNPVVGKKYLYEELSGIVTAPNVSFACILVPRHFHNKFNTAIPLLEYVAKNIGIRRAGGEFIVATNPDIIMGEEVMHFLCAGALRGNEYYRTHRHDLKPLPPFSDLPAEKVLKRCKQRVAKILCNRRTIFLSYQSWLIALWHNRNLKRLLDCPLFGKHNWRLAQAELKLTHGHGAGDFLMMHRDLWAKVRGYDQTPLSAYFDSYILYVLNCYGFRQIVLPYPIYHINHRVDRNDRDELPLAKYKNDRKKMEATGIPYKINDPDWGFPTEKFTRVVLSP